ncbi:signal transduction histidine kinase [Undibacterium sp. GrIS 1.8]|uniref:HAMP domain-containing sensor histidine kinase n=1 Tax=Undibacterium sp. GrIS 1.8 TaxID=3143934 RepID=UPI00339797AE
MNRSLWLRFFGISIFFACVLSTGYVLVLREITGRPTEEVQRSVYLFIAQIVEQQSNSGLAYQDALAQVQRYRSESPAMPLELWVINAENQIIASSTNAAPPLGLLQRAKPVQVHELITRGRFFSGSPATAIIRLSASQPAYLLVRNPGSAARGTFFSMSLLFVTTLIGAILLGLLMTMLYLRGRSSEAKQVIQQMESGNLSARFQAGKLDAVGGLMLNFNQMADEIQRLVTQLQAIERTRRELLQELGHDLRTPLTSLRTSIDTLSVHGENMSEDERAEFFAVVSSEIDYFTKLIDDLFFIANIDEPRYRKQASSVDLFELATIEMRNAQNSNRNRGGTILFEMEAIPAGVAVVAGIVSTAVSTTAQDYHIIGDAYLISRLFHNVYENAARYARSSVRTHIIRKADRIEITVQDDGDGMSEQVIRSFGQRRDQRVLVAPGKAEISLGLGSVIIKTIVELHGGHFTIRNLQQVSAAKGTCLSFSFPAR